MRFLYPHQNDNAFGLLTSPQNARPKHSQLWAADNNAFTQGFRPYVFFNWLDSLWPFRDSCLFVTVPDVVGDALQTLDNWRHWVRYFEGWPLAFVAQDGQENLNMPTNFDTLFVGGSTKWKESQGAIDCIKRAQKMRKHIHIGRVNWQRRYNLFNVLDGSILFTCDGTRPRFDGKNKTHKAWEGYMAQRPLITI
jgi:hypothetical protein